jgi:hypothetical protein
MSLSTRTSRREFLKQSLLVSTAAMATPCIVARRVLGFAGSPGANEQIVVGVVGVGVRGKQLIRNIKNLSGRGRVAAICDCDGRKVAETLQEHRADWKTYGDYRRLIEQKGLDGVLICTPHHQHVLPAMLACQAGLDVYVEKPLSNYVKEGRALVAAARKGMSARIDFRYANGVEVQSKYQAYTKPQRGPLLGAIFVGDRCKIEINRNKFTTNPRDFVKNPPDPKLAEKWEGDGWVAQGHIENWFDCIKSRAKPTADVEIGHRTVTVGHLINIAREVGRKLRWNPDKEEIADDPEANALLDRPRRKGWELPQIA